MKRWKQDTVTLLFQVQRKSQQPSPTSKQQLMTFSSHKQTQISYLHKNLLCYVTFYPLTDQFYGRTTCKEIPKMVTSPEHIKVLPTPSIILVSHIVLLFCFHSLYSILTFLWWRGDHGWFFSVSLLPVLDQKILFVVFLFVLNIFLPGWLRIFSGGNCFKFLPWDLNRDQFNRLKFRSSYTCFKLGAWQEAVQRKQNPTDAKMQLDS